MVAQRTRFARHPTVRPKGIRMTESTSARASRLLQLHQDPHLLTVVNVWDVVSATVSPDSEARPPRPPGSHSIAASHGYEDGEKIPVEEMIDAVGRMAAATSPPATADLEGGYGAGSGNI